MELYQLKMEIGGNLHDHFDAFNQLVCQLVNADDKISDKQQALLLLASLPRSYKPLVKTLLVRKTTLKLDEVTAALQESEKMTRNDNVNKGDHALAIEDSERGMSHSRKQGQPRGRSKSQSRIPCDMSNMECYYCEENGMCK